MSGLIQFDTFSVDDAITDRPCRTSRVLYCSRLLQLACQARMPKRAKNGDCSPMNYSRVLYLNGEYFRCLESGLLSLSACHATMCQLIVI